MHTHWGFFPVVAAIAIVATLTGCSSGTASPTNPATSASPSQPPTATPQPTATQAATPPILLDGNCSDLIPLTSVRAALPDLVLDAQTPPATLDAIPLPQADGVQCNWFNPKRTQGFSVSLLPNAAAAFAENAAAMKKHDDAASGRVRAVPTYGDQSFTQCLSTGDDPAYGCDINILQGSVWISVQQQTTSFANPYPEPAGLRQFLSALVAKVKTLPAVAQWVPPSDGVTVPTSCAAILTPATLRTDTGLSLRLSPDALVADPIDGAVFTATGSAQCEWVSTVATSGRSTIKVWAVPGSGWAWTGNAPPKSASTSALTAESGLGDAAVGGCASTECDVFVLTGHTWFQVANIHASGAASFGSTIKIARSVLAALAS